MIGIITANPELNGTSTAIGKIRQESRCGGTTRASIQICPISRKASDQGLGNMQIAQLDDLVSSLVFFPYFRDYHSPNLSIACNFGRGCAEHAVDCRWLSCDREGG